METLSKHFREITKAAFSRTASHSGRVANWDAIVGGEFAAVSAPERIKWPKGSGEEAQKQGGTLVIRAARGRALELQYEASRIISRINSFFGYGAVSAVKVIQAQALPQGRPAPTPLPEKPVFVNSHLLHWRMAPSRPRWSASDEVWQGLRRVLHKANKLIVSPPNI